MTMNTKDLKQTSIKVGNTTVEAVEVNGVVTIQINSLKEDAVVLMNDTMIWSVGNEKEEFKYIPQSIHQFLLASGMDHIEYREKDKLTVVDVYVHGESLTFYFPVNQKKPIKARFDLITSVEDVKDYLYDGKDDEKYLQELTVKFESLKSLVSSKGYKLSFSHAMGDFVYGWWDIVFDTVDFDEEKIKEIMKLVVDFNKFVHKMKRDLGI